MLCKCARCNRELKELQPGEKGFWVGIGTGHLANKAFFGKDAKEPCRVGSDCYETLRRLGYWDKIGGR